MSDELPQVYVDEKQLRKQSRRDFILFGAGTFAALAGLWWISPMSSKKRLFGEHTTDVLDTAAARFGFTKERSERFQNRALTFDDDVAEAMYSPTRSVRTYRRSDITPLRNNYNGRTPSPGYIDTWTLTLTGLASGTDVVLRLPDLARLEQHAQVTRLCCVEGWSAIAGWSGIRFADLLRAYRPAAGAKWASLESAVNLDGAGNPDPYYVSIDLPTAQHPQTLLATHLNGSPLAPDHGAPLRLVAPMKLGLKNIKAITKIAYVTDQPHDYWGDRGYSKYDGL
jgi:DMSO/TMAO reductase YedYZ molybdopterin-dependent catalytic subunit